MLGLNIGVDLGTASVIIYVQGKGIVLSEPSAVAYLASSGRLCAVGRLAYEMIDRTPESIRVVRPLTDGVVSDFTVARQMLRIFLSKICGNRIFKPNVIVSTPANVTNLEKRTVLDIITAAGAGKACLIEEPLAAVIGAGEDISRPGGTMVVDIGGGTTDIAVVTMGSISVAKSIKIAGNVLTGDIQRQLRRERDILTGMLTVEEIKKSVGCAYLRDEEMAVNAKGKHYITGMPVVFEVTSTETYLAMREHIEAIADAVCEVLEQTPPELVGDIGSSGILLTGGGSLLYGMEETIKRKTGIETHRAADPVNCVANGIGMALGDLDLLAEQGYIFKTREEITGFREDA